MRVQSINNAVNGLNGLPLSKPRGEISSQLKVFSGIFNLSKLEEGDWDQALLGERNDAYAFEPR